MKIIITDQSKYYDERNKVLREWEKEKWILSGELGKVSVKSKFM